ncbi:YifB family Mg chelatase-like AAA ATPase [Spirochaeta dissipatitropha]
MVRLDVDIRYGIPGLHIIGLPEGAVREARERVRIALSNSGFAVVQKKILVSLGPADLPKAAAGLDLAIALAIIAADFDLKPPASVALGELTLHGQVIGVPGVLAAIHEGRSASADQAFIPEMNRAEAALCGGRGISCVENLTEAWHALASSLNGVDLPGNTDQFFLQSHGLIEDCRPTSVKDRLIYGTARTLRIMELAAAGAHHCGFFGPPGTGKTMSAIQLGRLLPSLGHQEMIETARIWSLASLLEADYSLIKTAPVRMPHQSASTEGLVGGGKNLCPGEFSLAHNGLLILDEVAEFDRNVLQALREPLESGRIRLVRANLHADYPARAVVCITANLCPCGGFSKPGTACACSPGDISRYWRKFGGAVLDRIALRCICVPGERQVVASRSAMQHSVLTARQMQLERSRVLDEDTSASYNGRLSLAELLACNAVTEKAASFASRMALSAGMSFRGALHVLQIARTIADLKGEPKVNDEHILESLEYRKIADGGTPWACVDRAGVMN